MYIITTKIRGSQPVVKKALLGQIADTDVRLLRVFKVVAESGGFSAAELELNISRSTISRHIKDLETRLSVNLCRRGRAGFGLTAEGRQVYEGTLRMLAAIDEFRAEVRSIHQSLGGTLVLALFDKTVTNPESKISNALRLFDDRAPEAEVEIRVGALNEIERGVIDGRYHLGIIPGHRTSSSLVYHELFQEQVHLYCGQGHVLFELEEALLLQADVFSCRYAGLGYHSPNMELGRELKLTRHATAYDQEAIAQLILSGRYLGHLPDHYAASFERKGQLRKVIIPRFSYNCSFYVITRRSPTATNLASAFLDCLTDAHQHNIRL
ncbi:MAG: DNA-binding transcriptional LysR family regulator [Halieaceae bacterium]|jgi:DNA-binding transcriptional LysR family regulator